METPAFNNLVDFTLWCFNKGLALKPPLNAEVFTTDDATSSCLYRHGRFQLEVYLIHSEPVIPQHEHPGVESLEVPLVSLSFDQNIKNLDQFILGDGMSHGMDIRTRADIRGFVLYSAQKWDDGLEMSTIASRWKGHTAGPKHEALIRRFNPDCLIYPGYADVTRRRVMTEVL